MWHTNFYLLAVVLLFKLNNLVAGKDENEKVVYKFAEFPYKETTKNELAFREYETACERNCVRFAGPTRFACVRECVSPSCYRQIYANDPLEDGEIDVRLNSFKGCFTQRLNKPRS